MIKNIFSKETFLTIKSVINLKIFFNVLYFIKLILNSPYNCKKIP